jgi:hypothetical protein
VSSVPVLFVGSLVATSAVARSGHVPNGWTCVVVILVTEALAPNDSALSVIGVRGVDINCASGSRLDYEPIRQ